MRSALLGVFVVAPGLLLLVGLLGKIAENPSLLLWIIGVPVGLFVLMILYLGAAQAPPSAPARGQPLPPDSLSPPQPAVPGLERAPTTVPGNGAESPGYGNMLRFQRLRRLPAQWRYRSPGMRPPADGSPPT
ncbi:MAG: hypothetical protein ACOYKQ_05155 [Polymorphobacter sp.]